MAWNQPGNNGNQTGPGKPGKPSEPPQLDELFRKLGESIRRLFAIKAKSPIGPGAPSSPKKTTTHLSWNAIAFILLALWFLSGIFIVDPAEQAVVLRLGKYYETLGPGPHWIPRFIDRKYLVNVQKISSFSYADVMLTKDENIVSVDVAIQYRVGDLKDFLFNVVNPVESLKQATASALRQTIGHTTLDEVLTVGREKVRQETSQQLKEILSRYKTGLEITDVVMQPVSPPEEVKAAFDDAIKATEDEQKIINQAQAYARGVEPIAKGNAKRLIQEAEAYKKKIILDAQGDVSRFNALLQEYNKAPQIMRERLYLDTYESILGNTSKIVVDVKGGNNMMVLPLDRLIQSNVSTQSVVQNEQTPTEVVEAEVPQEITPPSSVVTPPAKPASTIVVPRRNPDSRTGREGYSGREKNP
ncbi:MAG: FtsH protease activity modulator HflK [Proteobacteria bacterium]|nr:FtsH protease activity modulator HflK [Pseudomonadota bacterium]